MYPRRHAARFVAYGFAAVALATRNRWLLVAAVVGGAAYASKPLKRAWRRSTGRPGQRVATLAAVPAAMVFLDLAKMSGYIAGRVRGRPTVRVPRSTGP
jgi:hypothetical protein